MEAIDHLNEVARYLEAGIRGIAAHRLEFSSVGVHIRLYRMAGDDTQLEKSAHITWESIKQARPFGAGSILLLEVEKLRKALFTEDVNREIRGMMVAVS